VYIQYDLGESNAELALDYGFIELTSDRNAYTRTLEISKSDPFMAMLPYLRLVALGGTDAFLFESLFRNTTWGHLELPVSQANEELICRVVRDACIAALSGFHTTINEYRCILLNEDLKKRGNLSPRLEIVVGIRAGEKKVLRQIEEIFKERESELDTLEYSQERRLKDLGLVGNKGKSFSGNPSRNMKFSLQSLPVTKDE
ncbi:Rubisco LSMT, substrate-binding domain, partial [Dillenia turbinata]